MRDLLLRSSMSATLLGLPKLSIGRSCAHHSAHHRARRNSLSQ